MDIQHIARAEPLQSVSEVHANYSDEQWRKIYRGLTLLVQGFDNQPVLCVRPDKMGRCGDSQINGC